MVQYDGVYFKLSQHQVVGGDTNHGPASAGVPTGRNQVRQFEMHLYDTKSNITNCVTNKQVVKLVKYRCFVHVIIDRIRRLISIMFVLRNTYC